jgi:hypothetical protein
MREYLQLYASLSFKIKDVEIVYKITEDALHKIYKEATIPVVS